MRHHPMNLCFRALLALAAPFAACVSNGSVPVGSVEVAIVKPAEAGATSMPYGSNDLAIDGERLRISVTKLSIGRDPEGGPTVYMELADSDGKRFSDWTEANLNKGMAVIVGGKIVQVALIQSRLPGALVVFDGPEGLSPSGAEEIVAKIRAFK